MPVYPKTGRRGTWRVVLSVERRQREWAIQGKKTDAKAFEARMIQEHRLGSLASQRGGSTFSAFCQSDYARHAKMHLRASTWKVRRYHLATLMDHFGDTRLHELRTEHVEKFKETRKEAGRKPRSINNELAVLCAVRAYAKKLKLPIGDFSITLLPVVGRGRVTFWTNVQLAQLFAAVEEHAGDLLPLVVHIANTGCRKGEALACERPWIDLKRRMINIPVNEDWQPKDNEPREVPISDALLPWLERAVERAERAAAERKAGRAPDRMWLFPSRAGERFAAWPKLQFDRARKLAGRCADCRDRAIKSFARCENCEPALRGGPHTLRHTFAAHFLQAQPDMYLLSQLLGHSETRTTKLYAHLLPSHLERARNAVSLGPSIGPAQAEARRRWKKAAE